MSKIDFTNRITPILRLNSICPYFTMFPLDFPFHALKLANNDDLVFDPFCGRGTTNYAARLRGLNSFGIDSNPVAKSIAEVKLLKVLPKDIVKIAKQILVESDNPVDVPSGDFWDLAFHFNTLLEICIYREYFISKSRLSKAEKALKAILLGSLHGPLMKTQPSYLSNQMPRTFSSKPDYSIRYWEKNNLNPSYVDSLNLIKRKADYVFNKDMPAEVSGKILLSDSRKGFAGKIEPRFNWVITSPPYYGMHSYEQDQWLRNWFLGGTDFVNYSTKSQVKHYSEKIFIEDLAKVWTNTANVCNPNAKLIIRFGSLPSKSEKTPSELIKESIRKADCGWQIRTIRNAGQPKESNRQANQFKNATGNYVEEIDVFAILNN
jgi:hypothetical protein